MFLSGMNLAAAGVATALTMTAIIVALLRRWSAHTLRQFSIRSFRWYEWALLGVAGEKIVFAVWQLVRLHTYFVDALMHWSGRARALFGEVNWSMDPASPFFLALENGMYPLQGIPWRCLETKWENGTKSSQGRMASSFLS